MTMRECVVDAAIDMPTQAKRPNAQAAIRNTFHEARIERGVRYSNLEFCSGCNLIS